METTDRHVRRSTRAVGGMQKLLRWPILLVIAGIVALEFTGYILIRIAVRVYEVFIYYCARYIRGDHSERSRNLLQRLKTAPSFSQYMKVAKELDTVKGLEPWKHENECECYDSELVGEILALMQTSKAEGEWQHLSELLVEVTTNCMQWFERDDLYSYCYHGTKRLAEEFLDTTVDALDALSNSPEFDLDAAKDSDDTTAAKMAKENDTSDTKSSSAPILTRASIERHCVLTQQKEDEYSQIREISDDYKMAESDTDVETLNDDSILGFGNNESLNTSLCSYSSSLTSVQDIKARVRKAAAASTAAGSAPPSSIFTGLSPNTSPRSTDTGIDSMTAAAFVPLLLGSESIRNRLTLDEKIRVFHKMYAEFGRTALCLSGGGAMTFFQFGVIRELVANCVMPRVLSGASGGALVGALIAVRTDEELIGYNPKQQHSSSDKSGIIESGIESIIESGIENAESGEGGFLNASVLCGCIKPVEGQGSPLQRAYRLLFDSRHNCIMDYYVWRDALRKVVKGDMTFLEAFRHSGRVLNISMVNNRHKNMLLNYKRTPHIVLWSAVIASSSLPPFMTASPLIWKCPRTGVLHLCDDTADPSKVVVDQSPDSAPSTLAQKRRHSVQESLGTLKESVLAAMSSAMPTTTTTKSPSLKKESEERRREKHKKKAVALAAKRATEKDWRVKSKLIAVGVGQFFADGSIANDIPCHQLMRDLNARKCFAVQCNPHVFPFFYDIHSDYELDAWFHPFGSSKMRGGFVLAFLERLLKLDMRKWIKVVADLQLIPMFFGADWRMAALQESRGHHTMHPSPDFSDYVWVFSDQTLERWRHYLAHGKQMAHRSMQLIRARMRLANAIRRALVQLMNEKRRRRPRTKPTAAALSPIDIDDILSEGFIHTFIQ